MKLLKIISGSIATVLALTIIVIYGPKVEETWDIIEMVTLLALWIYFAVKFSYVIISVKDWIKKKVGKKDVD